MKKHIAFVGYDNVTTLDLFGPLEVFATANDVLGTRAYQFSTVCASGKVFRGESGVGVAADLAFRDAPAFDTILVPGGAGLRDPEIGDPVVAFLKARLRSTRRIVSVCTGLEALAQAGFMNWTARHHPLALCRRHREEISADQTGHRRDLYPRRQVLYLGGHHGGDRSGAGPGRRRSW